MKNFIRVCAGLAAVFLVPGILCLVMGTALGGSWSEAMRYTSVGDSRGFNLHLMGWYDDYDDYGDYDGSYEHAWREGMESLHHSIPVAPEAPEAPEPPQAPEAPAAPGAAVRLGSYKGMENLAPAGVAGAGKLEFEMGAIKAVEIVSGEGFGLYTEGDAGQLTTHMDGSTWKIETENHHRNKAAGYVYIVLPQGMTFEKIELESSAGNMTGDGLRANKLEANANAGDLDLTNVWAAGMDLEAKAGSVSVQGELTGRAELTAQAGSVYLLLPEPQEANYGNYEVENNLGSVEIGGHSVGLGHTSKSISGATLFFEVECDVGSVNVEFE